MNKMAVIVGVILIIVASVLAYMWSQGRETSPRATPAPVETQTQQPQLPPGWVRGEDEALNYTFAYPEEFEFQPATSEENESAFYSFNTKTTPDTGVIPLDELKIAVVFFPDNTSRELSFDESTITATETLTVDGRTATRHTIEGEASGSVSTTVETENGTYLISAHPPDSEQLHVYNEFLTHVSLNN